MSKIEIVTKTKYYVDDREFSSKEDAQKHLDKKQEEKAYLMNHDSNVALCYWKMARMWQYCNGPQVLIWEHKHDIYYYLIKDFNDIFEKLAKIYDICKEWNFYYDTNQEVLDSIENYVSPVMAKAAFVLNRGFQQSTPYEYEEIHFEALR